MTKEQMIEAQVEFYARRQEQSLDEALRGIERARQELDRVEKNLAGAIFAAFGAIENVALLSKMAEGC